MTLTALAFLALYTAGCLAAFVRHPIFGLLTYLLAFYMHPPSRWWGESLPQLRWSFIAAVVTLIAIFLNSKKMESNGRFFGHALPGLLLVLVMYMAVQLGWALDLDLQLEILTLYVKYWVLVFLIYRLIDSEENLRLFLWAHVAGCSMLGWIAFQEYEGGRFEGFGGADISEANAGALQLVTGTLVAGSLFLAGSGRAKAAVIAVAPFIVNGIITTISRSGFLAVATGGFIYNLFAPRRYRGIIKTLSVLAAILFLMLTSPQYWARIATLKQAGEQDVYTERGKRVDTGAGRLKIIEAQWRMFQLNPMGQGHRSTALLSTQFLERRYLTDAGGVLGRSSHNTFMSMLVEHGVLGAFLYVAIVVWSVRACLRLWRLTRHESGLVALMAPTAAAVLGAITIGDLFVDYIKLEVRLWFCALLMACLDLQTKLAANSASAAPAPGPALLRRPVGNAVPAPTTPPALRH